MRSKYYFHRAVFIPPHKLALKVMERTGREIKFFLKRQNDFRSSTYTQPILSPPEELHRYFQVLPINLLHSQVGKISVLSELFLAHQFNLLGSGWVQVKHGMSCNGLEGYRYEMGSSVLIDSQGHWLKGRVNQSNLAESLRIWPMVDHDYIPIDWHLDFKSGYRWAEDIWYLDVPHGHKPGVDIKVPWELARMQHFPHLVWAYVLSGNGEARFQPPQVYVREFHNQVLDFIATNPPRFGVNWKSSTDVGIRVANWLITYDLFRACGVEFDNKFETEFFRSIYQHGRHIINNLEWNGELRGNHYLANVASLLFVAAYLPCTPETDGWLAFAAQELIKEVGYQFASDGTNFEASTSYHRLSAEMVIYATALILGLPEEKQAALKNYDCRLFKGHLKLNAAPIPLYALAGSDRLTPLPRLYSERLEKMAEFTMHITKPNGEIIQIGDNDSGRFLKLQPIRESNCHCSSLDENYLDHRHLVAAINGLFDREDFTAFMGQGWFETDVVRSLAGNTRLPSYLLETNRNREDNESKLYVFSGFGLYIYRSKNMHLAIRCGSIGQKGNGGHAHNDQLSFELSIKDRNFLVDGGSYLYTPIPEIRNEFRSTRTHNTLSMDGFEQNQWRDGLNGLFSMKNDAKYRILKCNDEYFEGEYVSRGIRHARSFKFGTNNIVIEDTLQGNQFGELNLNFAFGIEIIQISKNGFEEFTLEFQVSDICPRVILNGFSGVEISEGFFSKGYGERLKNQLLKCHRSKCITRTTIEMGIR